MRLARTNSVRFDRQVVRSQGDLRAWAMTTFPSFEIRQLYYFTVVVEQGQITRAAAKLHIAQPALSQMMAKLEKAVGVRLLERHPRGVDLTPAGALFYEKASLAVRSAQEAEAVVGPFARAESSVVFGFTASFHPFARPIMRRFVERRPDVQLHMLQLDPTRRMLDLLSGTVDAELLLAPAKTEAGLVIEVLSSEPRYVLLPEGHPLASESSLEFEQIAGETFPGRDPGVTEQWARDAWLSDRRGHDPKVTAETPLTLDEVWALVHAGKAVSVLPRFMVTTAQGNGVRAIPLVDVEPVEVGIARREEDRRGVVLGLMEVAVEVAAERDAAQEAAADTAPSDS